MTRVAARVGLAALALGCAFVLQLGFAGAPHAFASAPWFVASLLGLQALAFAAVELFDSRWRMMASVRFVADACCVVAVTQGLDFLLRPFLFAPVDADVLRHTFMWLAIALLLGCRIWAGRSNANPPTAGPGPVPGSLQIPGRVARASLATPFPYVAAAAVMFASSPLEKDALERWKWMLGRAEAVLARQQIADSQLVLEPMLPGVFFMRPTDVVVHPEDAALLVVVEKRGTVQLVDRSKSPPEKRLFLDLRERVGRANSEKGAMSLRFHPAFARGTRNVFVYYTSDTQAVLKDRLSRFEVREGVALPESEQVLIEQRDRHRWHNGGGMAFGPDGFLYLGLGDGGSGGDGDANAQKIDENLFAGIVRIDVDRRGGSVSHPIRNQPRDGRTADYFIPSDNPFVGIPGALEEFYSIGLRNPFRLHFDPVTGELWVPDVGQRSYEEINLATRGSNHQWSYAEGPARFVGSYLAGEPPEPLRGVETPPLYAYRHTATRLSVIGGVVYRGARLPALEGAYLHADHVSGELFALRRSTDGSLSHEVVTRLPWSKAPGISAVKQLGDELVALRLGDRKRQGELLRLVRRSGASSTAPVPFDATAQYQLVCSRCHGERGEGDDEAVPNGQPAARNFADAQWQASVSDARIASAIHDGGGEATGLSPLMPAWGEFYSDAEIAQLVEVIRRFGVPRDER